MKSQFATPSYLESVKRGVEHVGDRWNQQAVDYLNAGNGDRLGCLEVLLCNVEARSLMSWFKSRDLRGSKQWAYLAAKTQRMIFQIKPWRWFPAYEHLYALLSDHEELIDWYSRHRLPFYIQDEERGNEALNKDDPALVTFHSYQALLALQGRWEDVHRRCEQILSLPETADGREFLVDHRFYLALAEGDRGGMEAALNQLASPEMARVRNSGVAFGLTRNLIATHATIYAKIAWRHGY